VSKGARRHGRRGYNLAEVVIASAITVQGQMGLGSAIAMSARLQQQVSIRSEASQAGAMAMQRMVLDVQEAKEVQVLAPHQFRIYYPATSADGFYDRFRTDYNVWVEYAQTDQNGTPSATGAYLWRRTNATSGRSVAREVTQLQAASNSEDSIRLSLTVARSSGRYSESSRLNQRVIFLRNY
jgi:hypothetical protein